MSQYNLQKPTNHLFEITKPGMKTFNFQCQSVMLPGFSAGTVGGASPKIGDFAIIGTTATYGDLVLSILLDEKMDSYFELYKWLKELIEPEKGNPVSFKDSVAEAILFITTNNKSFMDFSVEFHQIWPYAVSEIPFDTTTTDDAPLTFTATFKYRTYTIHRDGIGH